MAERLSGKAKADMDRASKIQTKWQKDAGARSVAIGKKAAAAAKKTPKKK